MSQPAPTGYELAEVSPELSLAATAFVETQQSYVASKIFPSINSTNIAGKYPILDRGAFLRIDARKRAPATEAVVGGYGTAATGTYYCDKYSIKNPVADEYRTVNGLFGDERTSAIYVANQVMLLRELEWVNTFFKPGVWGTTLTPGTAWNVAGSKPISDISDQILAGTRLAGLPLNTLVLGPLTWQRIKNNADFIGRISGGANTANPALLTTEGLAGMLGLDNVFILNAVQNVAKEGQPDDLQFIAGNHALLTYVSPNASLVEPSAGYTMIYKPPEAPENILPPGVTVDPAFVVKRWRDVERAAVWVEANSYAANIFMSAKMGVFFENAVAA